MDKHLSYWEESCPIETFEGWHNNSEGMVRQRHHIAESMRIYKYKSILDCGAGTGLLYETLKEVGASTDTSYRGIDITPKFIDYAVAHDRPVELGDAENLKYDNESFDLCVVQNLINHLYTYENVIAEALRVAKESVILTLHKPSVEAINYVAPAHKEHIIGYYPGKWDRGNLQLICPYVGFYPNGWIHSENILIKKRYKKLYVSPLGFYVHSEFDKNTGEAICIHHHYEYQKLIDYILNYGKKNNKKYKIDFAISTGQTFSENYLADPAAPPKGAWADTIIVKKNFDWGSQ